MKKTIGKRLLSGVTAFLLAASSVGLNAIVSDDLPVASAASEDVEVLVKDDSDPNKVQKTDKSTLLVGDGVMLESEPAKFKGNTVAETIVNYDKRYALGIASQFCLFLAEDFNPKESDAEGRVAVGRNIKIDTPSDWGGYAIGKGDYVTNETLDNALGKTESPGYAHIIMGGALTNQGILSQSYSGTNTRKLVINVDNDENFKLADHSTATNLPIASTSIVDQTQTYVANLFSFSSEFAKLKEKSIEWANEPTAGSTKGVDYEYDSITNTFRFYFNGKTSALQNKNVNDQAEYVYFTVADSDWADYAKAENVEFVNIPKLPESVYGPNGRKIMDVDNGRLTEEYWDRSFIVVSCNNTSISIADPGNGSNGQKFTKINGEWISRDNKNNKDSSWNNHKGTSGLLYNFPNATEVIIGNNFQGTIFAYQAAVTDWWSKNNLGDDYRGHLSGSLIAKSFSGGTEFGYRPFAGIALPDSSCAVELSKVDPENTFVKDAKLKLEKLVKDVNGTVEIDGVTYTREAVTGYDEFLSTGKTQLIENIEPGYYVLSEIEAPKGYTKTDKEIYFEISDGDAVYTSIETGGNYEKPIIYVVVDDDTPEDINGKHLIHRDTADAADSQFIAVNPKSANPVSYSWKWANLAYNDVSVETIISNITLVYNNGYKETVVTNQYVDADTSWHNVVEGRMSNKNDIISVTITIKLNTSDANQKENLGVIFYYEDENGQTKQELTLRNVTAQEKTYVLYGESDPTEYYLKDSDSEVKRNGEFIQAINEPFTTVVSNRKGMLTVYTDETFTKEADTTTYEGNPLDIENNVYNINGVNYVFKNVTATEYEVYTYNNQNEEATLPNVEVKKVDGGYIVLNDGAVIDPVQILTRQLDEEFGFKVINKHHIYLNKIDTNGTIIDGAKFELKAEEGKTVDWSKVFIVTYDDDDVKTATPLGSTASASVELTFGELEIEGLPDGKYTLTETAAPSDNYTKFDGTVTFEVKDGEIISYEVEPDDSDLIIFDDDNNKISVTNTEMDNTCVTVEKKWVLPEGVSATEVSIQLTINQKIGEVTEEISKDLYEALELGENNTISFTEAGTWTSPKVLPKTTEDGEEIEYTVVPKELTTGNFKTEYTNGTNAVVTNTYEETELTINKTWTGIELDKLTVTELEFSVSGSTPKKDFAYPTTKFIVEPTADGKWTGLKIPGLPKYYDGEEITYTIDEIPPKNFKKKVTSNGDNTFDVENTFSPNLTSVTIAKIWAGDTPANKVPSISIKVKVFRAIEEDGVEVAGTKEDVTSKYIGGVLDNDGYVTITLADPVWTWTELNNLPEYSEDGKKYTYSVEAKEDAPEYYKVSYENNNTANVTIINTYEATDITITKKWAVAHPDMVEKSNNRKAIMVVLVGTIDNDTENPVYGPKTYTITKADGDIWTLPVSGLPKYVYRNGEPKEINYSITEVTKVSDDGYIKSENGTTVTNTYFEQGKTNVSVTKIWDDDDATVKMTNAKIYVKITQVNGTTEKDITADYSKRLTLDEETGRYYVELDRTNTKWTSEDLPQYVLNDNNTATKLVYKVNVEEANVGASYNEPTVTNDVADATVKNTAKKVTSSSESEASNNSGTSSESETSNNSGTSSESETSNNSGTSSESGTTSNNSSSDSESGTTTSSNGTTDSATSSGGTQSPTDSSKNPNLEGNSSGGSTTPDSSKPEEGGTSSEIGTESGSNSSESSTSTSEVDSNSGSSSESSTTTSSESTSSNSSSSSSSSSSGSSSGSSSSSSSNASSSSSQSSSTNDNNGNPNTGAGVLVNMAEFAAAVGLCFVAIRRKKNDPNEDDQ